MAADASGLANQEVDGKRPSIRQRLDQVATEYEELQSHCHALAAENQKARGALAFQKEAQDTIAKLENEKQKLIQEKQQLLDEFRKVIEEKQWYVAELEKTQKNTADIERRVADLENDNQRALKEKSDALEEKRRYELAVEASHKALDAMEEKIRTMNGSAGGDSNSVEKAPVLDAGALFAAVEKEEAAEASKNGAAKKATRGRDRGKKAASSSSSSRSGRRRSKRRSRSRGSQSGSGPKRKLAAKANPSNQQHAQGSWPAPPPGQAPWVPPAHPPADAQMWGRAAPPGAPPAPFFTPPNTSAPGTWGAIPTPFGAGGWGQSAPPSGWVGPGTG